MRKLTKKISMLMVLAMLVGLFSGVVSASAASKWSFKSNDLDVAVGATVNLDQNQYENFDLYKSGVLADAPEYTITWKSSDEKVVFVNAKTGQLRAKKDAADGAEAVITANIVKGKATHKVSFTIVVGEVKAPVYTVEQADVTAVLGDAIKFAPVVKNADGKVVKFATHKSYNGYFLDGKAIANPWTPEEAGEYTVTVAQFAKKANVADLAKAVRKTEVKVTVTVDEFDAKATGVKEITVYGDFAKDAKFTVKKGTGINVAFTAVVAEDGKSAKLALNNRITKGVYTVTYGDASVNLDCEDEKPVKVIIEEKDGVVAVDSTRTKAYAHYDVLNQYGQSIRKTTNVQVTSSTSEKPIENRATGEVVISTTGSATFIYGSQIVLNIAATGYSAFESAIMTAGLENSVNAVEVVGITLADSNKILDEIPVNFLGAKDESVGNAKDDEATYFYLLFHRLDRAGHVMDVPVGTKALKEAKDQLFFASLNPMLVKEFGNELETKRIDGVNYLAIKVIPGLMAKKGGVAQVEIRSNTTGGATPYEIRVVSDQILSQFNILPYEDIIVKNTQHDKPWEGLQTTVTLAYEAIDTNGEAITDFRALYDRVSFSNPDVKLEEAWDGSAKLTYTVPTSNMNPTKDFDVPVVINAIVPEGSGNTVTLYVKEQRFVDNVDGYYGNNTILETGSLDILLGSTDGSKNRVQVLDQYDTVLEDDNYQHDYNDATPNIPFFVGDTSNKRALYYGVKLTGKTGVSVTDTDKNAVEKVDDYYVFAWNKDVKLSAADGITEKTEQYTVEFVLLDADKKPLSASAKAYTFYVVDISQASSFTLATKWGADKLIENKDDDMSKKWDDKKNDYVERTDADTVGFEVTAHFPTGGTAVLDNDVVAGTSKYVVEYATEAKVYTKTSTDTMVSATGASYWVNAAYYTDNNVGPLKLASQFHNAAALNPDGTYASRNVAMKVTATVKIGAASGAGNYVNYQLRDTLKDTVEVGNHTRDWSAIVLESWFTGGIQATKGVLKHSDFVGKISMFCDNYNDAVGSWADANRNYLRNHTEVTISNVKENLDTGLKYGNLKLVNNAVDNANGDNKQVLVGVEAGDTFTLTYKIGGATCVIDCTVGPDTKAYIDGAQKAENVIWY